MSASHLHTAASQALASWVDEGGTLVAIVGAGLFDEHNKPQAILKPVYGIDDATLLRHHPTLDYNTLSMTEAANTVSLKGIFRRLLSMLKR